MVLYYLGYFTGRLQQKEKALEYFIHAAALKPDYCFPNRIEDIFVLQKATAINPADAKAYYYLGNFWYDKRQYEDAIECWEKSAEIDNSLSYRFQEFSHAYYNKLNNPQKALIALEKAFSLDTADARVLMELDQLYPK